MRRIAEGLVLGFAICLLLTVGSLVAALVVHDVHIPLVLSVRAPRLGGLPEIEMQGSPVAFAVVFVVTAASYTIAAHLRTRRLSGHARALSER